MPRRAAPSGSIQLLGLAALLAFVVAVSLLLAATTRLHRRIARQAAVDSAAIGAASVQALALEFNAAANWGILALHAAEAGILTVGTMTGAALVASGIMAAEGLSLIAETRDITHELLTANQQLAKVRDMVNDRAVPGLALGIGVAAGAGADMAVVPFPLGDDRFSHEPQSVGCPEALDEDVGSRLARRDPRDAGWNLQVDRIEARGMAAAVYMLVRGLGTGAPSDRPPTPSAIEDSLDESSRALADLPADAAARRAIAAAAWAGSPRADLLLDRLAARWRDGIGSYRAAHEVAARQAAALVVAQGDASAADIGQFVTPPAAVMDDAVAIVTLAVAAAAADLDPGRPLADILVGADDWSERLLPVAVAAMASSLDSLGGATRDLFAVAQGYGPSLSQRRGTSLIDRLLRRVLCAVDGGASAWLGESSFPMPTILPTNVDERQRFAAIGLELDGEGTLPALAVAEAGVSIPDGVAPGDPILSFGYGPSMRPVSVHHRLFGRGALTDMIDAFVVH